MSGCRTCRGIYQGARERCPACGQPHAAAVFAAEVSYEQSQIGLAARRPDGEPGGLELGWQARHPDTRAIGRGPTREAALASLLASRQALHDAATAHKKPLPTPAVAPARRRTTPSGAELRHQLYCKLQDAFVEVGETPALLDVRCSPDRDELLVRASVHKGRHAGARISYEVLAAMSDAELSSYALSFAEMASTPATVRYPGRQV